MKSARQPSAPSSRSPLASRGSVMGPAGSVGAATMISRVLGVAREMVLARYFGAGLFTDAFYIAYRVPNLLRDLFAEGALSAAFVPTFVRRLTEGGREPAWILANRVLSAVSLLLGGITLVFFFGAKGFVYLLASGYASDPEKFSLTVQMTQIMSPFLLWVGLASVGMGLLNACGSFFVPAMASSAFNICCILAGVFLSPFMPRWGLQPVVSMAIGVLVGGASQLLVMAPTARGYGFRPRFDLDFSDPDLRRMARLMLPAIVGLAATQINITVDSQIASHYGHGPVSWLQYAFRLMQFPIGVFGIAIATATTATTAHDAARNAPEDLDRTVRSGLRFAACLTFPSTVGLIVFREDIVRILYERGFFTPADTRMTAQALLFYALGLFSYSAVKIMAPAFYALDETRTPVRVSMITVGTKIALNLMLILPLKFLGLALATSAASWLNCGLLWRALRRQTGAQRPAGEWAVYARIGLASLLMGAPAWAAFEVAGFLWPGAGLWAQAFRLGLAILTGVASLFPLLRMLQVEEGSEIVRMLGLYARRAR